MFFSLLGNIGLIIPIIGLSAISLALIGSTTPHLFINQLIYFVIGFISFVVISTVDYKIWKNFSWIFYVFSLIFLIFILLTPAIRGSSRWIDIGLFSLQPSELIKPLMILIFSYFLLHLKKVKYFFILKPLYLFLPFILLIFLQPDLGNTIVYTFTYVLLEIINGLSLYYILGGIASLVVFFPMLWLFLKDYQKNRLLSFINPHADSAGAGYNAIQAMIAIGSGQLAGLGLGRGNQSHLLFLPEYHTDFVFASLGEELGFVGGAIVIFFYFFLLGKILLIAFNSEDDFGRLICIGAFAQLFIQVLINIGMNLGLMPITGITLPLLSYGGSSILSTFITLGLIASVSKKSKINETIVIK